MKNYIIPISLIILLIIGNIICYLINDRLLTHTTHVVILSIILINIYFNHKNYEKLRRKKN